MPLYSKPYGVIAGKFVSGRSLTSPTIAPRNVGTGEGRAESRHAGIDAATYRNKALRGELDEAQAWHAWRRWRAVAAGNAKRQKLDLSLYAKRPGARDGPRIAEDGWAFRSA